ncbi:MAG: hypothetical protein KDC84_02810 [Crocinitomicaceae bacterium]|nr:hypothetical protein [Crocinitomicaceae bacterium]
MKHILFICLFLSGLAFGQTSLFFQQKSGLNPALACIDNKASISISTVFAYSSFYTGRINGEYQIKDHHNVLFNGYYENLNGYNLFNLKFGYAYAFKFSDAFNMNIGLDLGVGILNTGFNNTTGSGTSGNFNGDLGLSVHGKSYYLGVNVQYVQKPIYNIVYPSGLYFNLLLGITKPIGENFRFSLDGAVNTGFGNNRNKAAVSARINIWGYFWFGLGYRYYEEFYQRANTGQIAGSLTRHDIVVPIGLQAKNFTFSYAFNYDLSNATATITSTFHEVIFGWRIPHADRLEEPGAQYVE